jgi:hypothetical protein
MMDNVQNCNTYIITVLKIGWLEIKNYYVFKTPELRNMINLELIFLLSTARGQEKWSISGQSLPQANETPKRLFWIKFIGMWKIYC